MWLAVPAAPPWYIREYGCGIDLAVAPSPAGLLRVDALLGIDYFAAFYSRAASVFGALPSMHCAYPLLGLLTARRAATWRTWPIHVGYTLLMFGASVYLDHHWIVDGLAGWMIAGFAVWAAEIADRRVSLNRDRVELAALT
jgi:membrane-associated phospholipid phosphatase